MDLEAAASYLVALAVPLWLIGEYVMYTWRTPRSSGDEGTSLVETRGHNRKVAPPAPMSGFEGHRRSA
jgi:hypothetical protein